MRVVFQRVESVNFRSFAAFELSLGEAGLTLVQGRVAEGLEALESNGAGKSSLFSSIAWALYGKFSHVSGSKVIGDKVIRRGCDGGTRVSVEMIIDEIPVVVERFRGDRKFGDKVRLFVDGVEQTQSSNAKTQAQIESLLGVSFETFSQIVYLSEATLRDSFAFETDSNRKKILVNAIPQLQKLSKARVQVKEALDVVQNSAQKLESELRASEEHERSLQEIDISTTTAIIEEQVRQLQAQIEECEESLRQQRENLENFREITINSETLQNEFAALQAECQDLEKESKSLAELKTALEVKIETLSKQEDKWRKLGSKCPVCERDVPPAFRDQHLTSLQQQITNFREQVSSLQERLMRVQQQREDRIHRLDVIMRKQKQAQTHLENLQSSMAMLQHSLALKQAELRKLLDYRDSLGKSLEVYAQRRQTLHQRINELNYLIQTIARYETSLKFWYEGFGPKGVLTFGLHKLLQLMSNHTEQWLHRIWHEGATCKFSVSRDSTQIEAKMFLNHNLVDIDSLSSGETRRLCLAISFALREILQIFTGWQTNLLVLDECVDGVDLAGRSFLLRQIGEAYPHSSIFVISQFFDVSDAVNKRLQIIKQADISTIREA